MTVDYSSMTREELIDELRLCTRRLESKRLQMDEARYRTILDNIEDGYFEIDVSGNFTFVSESLWRKMGYTTCDELIGVNYRDYTDEETAQRLFSLFLGVFQTGTPVDIDNCVVYDNDRARHFVRLRVFRMNRGHEPIGFRGVFIDMTERIEAESVLRESEERYRTLLEEIDEGYFETDLKGNMTFVNDALCRMSGYARDELIGMNYRRYSKPEAVRHVMLVFSEAYKTGTPVDVDDYEVFHRDGTVRIRQMHVSLKRNSQGIPVGFRGLSRDVTKQKRAVRELEESEERYRNLFTKTSSPIIIIDPRGNFMDYNEAALLFLECTREELKAKNISDFLPPDPERKKILLQERRELWRSGGTREVEYYVREKTKYLELAVTPTMLKGRNVVFCVGKDMTEHKETERRLAYMATHDQLTGLPNRVLFNDRLAMELSKARRYKKKLAVMFFDLDHFKDINDRLGHKVGDLLLKDLGGRLKDCLRKSDTVSRMGGDEFIMLLPDMTHEKDADLIAEKILSVIREPFLFGDHRLEVTASLGISFYPAQDSDPEALVKKADMAMYRAKESGRNRYRHYSA